ncbi:Cloroperoxidase [Periconia macrospinosa]|uniref:Cloroperoxidase n=1 Tax=Periconia macrospinosa TaxID=97972 RepID=A0A2V1D3C0_9PLEO|nr:Cloroperoxidase [Periconia macrospinosa]
MSEMFSRLSKKIKGGETAKPPTGTLTHHVIDVNWENWSPPGVGDVRSPCPAINALANHNILPHNGKGITKAMAVEALTKSFNVDPKIANVFAASGIIANPDHNAHTFDLNHVSKHNYIEHDGSLSRDDASFGDAEKFSPEAFNDVLETYRKANPGKSDDEIMTNWATAGHARWARILASKAKHEKAQATWIYGIKEAIMSYGETSLYLNLLGKDGVAPLQWVKIFFGTSRIMS